MSNIKIEYAGSVALTISLNALASDNNLLAGRESTAVDNTTNKYLDYLLAGQVKLGTTPTVSKSVEVWVFAMQDDSVWPDVFDGTDSNETVTSTNVKLAAGVLVASMTTDATTGRILHMKPVSIASLFGGSVPKKFVVFVVHDSQVALDAAAGGSFAVTPVYATSA